MRNGARFKIERFFFLLSPFGSGLNIKGSIFDILNILFSYFVALFFRRFISRVLKFMDLYSSRQACKVKLIFWMKALGRGGVVLGDGGGGYLASRP